MRFRMNEYVKIGTDVYRYFVDTGLWRKTEQTIYLACFCFSRNFFYFALTKSYEFRER